MICPICDGTDSSKLFEINRPELGKDISYHVWMCKSCHFRYAEGPVDEALLSRIYDKNFHATSQQYAPIDENGNFTAASLRFPIVRNALTRVEFLLNLGAKGKLLDIGAARGYFVKAASKTFQAEGIELNPIAASFGASMKVKIIAADFLTHDFGTKKYDVITMWDVLGSLPQPKQAIAKIHRLLKPGGLLVITLPDGESLAARLLKQYWPLMIPPINLGFYTRDSVERLLRAQGFKIKQISHDSKLVSVDFLLRKLFKTLRLNKLANTKLLLNPNFSLPINLRDIMTVVADREGR